jgi:ATP-dependent protease ClpP protease subunit
MSKTQNHKDDEATLSRGYFSNLKANAYTHEFYLSGPIEGPEEYIEWFNIIRNASEYDTIKMYINSGGGNLDTALQFMRVLSDTAASTVASVEGSCMSAATMVMLSCDGIEVSPHSLFMFHNYSGGTIGKGGEMYDNIVFERQWSRDFLADIYKWFLSSEEIESILNNRDIWLTSEQVAERLKVVLEMRQLEGEENSDLEESD